MTRSLRPFFTGLFAIAVFSCGGGGWQNEGLVASGAALSGKIFAANGSQYAAYADSTTSKLTVAQYSSGRWTALGDTGLTVTDTYNIALYVDGSTPYVAGIDSTTLQLALLHYANGAWVPVSGTSPLVGGSALYLAVLNGTAYVAFANASSVDVQSTGGSAWTDLGTPVPTTSTPTSYGMALLNGVPYVFYGDSSGGTLASYSNGAWHTVATTTVGVDYDDSRCAGNSPAVLPSGSALYVAYYNATNGAVMLKLSANNTLDPVGTLGSISGTDSVECITGAVYNGTPYVAFDDESRDSDPQPKAATVKQFSGSAWGLYAGYASPNDIEATQLVVDASNGHLYLTYQDQTLGGMTVQVH